MGLGVGVEVIWVQINGDEGSDTGDMFGLVALVSWLVFLEVMFLLGF